MIYNKINKTYPVMAHAPGDKANVEKYKSINKIWTRFSPVVGKLNTNLKIITCNNTPNKGVFEKSLDSLGYKYKVLTKDGFWRNLDKIKLFYDELQNTKEKYVVGCDSFDVICLREIPLLKNMLISTETKFFPDHDYLKAEKEFETKYGRFLNAGCWAGERDVCLKFFDICLEEIAKKPYLGDPIMDQSDQLIFHKAFYKMKDDIRLDYRSEVFQTVTFCSMTELFPVRSIL